MIIKELFEGPVGDNCIARNTIKCLINKKRQYRLIHVAQNIIHRDIEI